MSRTDDIVERTSTADVEALLAVAGEIAEAVTVEHFRRHPGLDTRYGPDGRQRCTEDGVRHVEFLGAALRADRPALFLEYLDWADDLLRALDLDPQDLVDHLDTLAEVVAERFEGIAESVRELVGQGRDQLRGEREVSPSLIDQSTPEGVLAASYLEDLLNGRRRAAMDQIHEALDDWLDLRDCYLLVFQPTLREIGRLWQIGRITVAQEHYATAATQLVMSSLYPRVFAGPKDAGRMVAASVGGELHEVGVRMVADFFELSGWDTHFLGSNTPAREVARMAVERQADVVAISATMSTHVDRVREMVAAVREATDAVILVGGRPFLLVEDLWEVVGADGTAADAAEAVEAATRLAGGDG